MCLNGAWMRVGTRAGRVRGPRGGARRPPGSQARARPARPESARGAAMIRGQTRAGRAQDVHAARAGQRATVHVSVQPRTRRMQDARRTCTRLGWTEGQSTRSELPRTRRMQDGCKTSFGRVSDACKTFSEGRPRAGRARPAQDAPVLRASETRPKDVLHPSCIRLVRGCSERVLWPSVRSEPRARPARVLRASGLGSWPRPARSPGVRASHALVTRAHQVERDGVCGDAFDLQPSF